MPLTPCRLTAHTAALLGKSAGGAPLDLATAAKAKVALGGVAADSSGTTTLAAGSFELPDGKKLSVTPATRVAMAVTAPQAKLGPPCCDPHVAAVAAG